MPLCPALFSRPPVNVLQRPCVCGHRLFSTSRALWDDSLFAKKNHYERLGVRSDALPGDIKKSFYKLSKVHHPDANPNSSSAHFSLLSESYTVLSDPSRRATYDRDVLRLHHQSSSSSAHTKGSYHSAGGRPATGLSRRRGTFRGPPPSFYRAGGYGAHTEKRQRAHEESTSSSAKSKGDPNHPHRQPFDAFAGEANRHGGGYSMHGGMGPGDDPFGHQDDVPHFDRKAHHRTQKREDERRWQRRHGHGRAVDEDDVEFEPQMSIGKHMMMILGILSMSLVVPAVYLRFSRMNRKKKDPYG